MPKPTKVFISYSHDSAEHKKMVLDLANRLRIEQGIDCKIDQHLLPAYPSEGWMKWMRDQINQADVVLMVCTQNYRDRYERNTETGGNGVAFEGLIISEILYNEYFNSLKFIPVICDDGNLEHISPELRGKNIYSVPKDFQTLVDLIKGKQYNPLPPLAKMIQVERPPKHPAVEVKSPRDAELSYLKTLLERRATSFATDTYITLSGNYQTDRQYVPDDMIPISYRHHKSAKDKIKVHKAAGEIIRCRDLIKACEYYQRLIILGEPGAGKTFSLWKIAADKAAKALSDETSVIPVVIHLNRWTDETQSLQDFVLEQMGVISPFFETLVQQKRLLPLLDALNEIPFEQRSEKAPQVKHWIEQDIPNLVISCRERDYTGWLVQDLNRLVIEPLDPPHIYNYLENYFGLLYQDRNNNKVIAERLFWRLAGGEAMENAWQLWQDNRPAWKIRIESIFLGNLFSYFWKDRIKDIPSRMSHLHEPFEKPSWENFWLEEQAKDWYWDNRRSSYYTGINREVCYAARNDYFQDSRRLMKLAKNPYLLNLIIFIYRENQQQLPENRYHLFNLFVTDLLKREVEDSYKAQAKNLIPDQISLLNSLKNLAWQLQGKTTKREARTTIIFNDAIEKQIITEEEVRFSAAANILDLTNDTIKFSHQLLQEYFTAQNFEAKIETGLKASEIWDPNNWWVSNGWEEAAKFAADHEKDPSKFLHWLAEGNPYLAVEILLALNLLDSKNEILLDYKATWQAAILNTESYPNPSERHVISKVLASLDWDERKGVCTNNNQHPNIDWVKIPEDESTYGERNILSLETFYISRYPVTNSLFQQFIHSGGYDKKKWWGDNHVLKNLYQLSEPEANMANRPAMVNWYESMAFCRWLSAEAGEDIRLPTEQQWEKAARGSSSNKYPWGNEYILGYANNNESTHTSSLENSYLNETTAVGIYPQAKSPYGVMDMCGNVREWCLNKYAETKVTTPDKSIHRSGDHRVTRGSAYYSHAASYSSSHRGSEHPYFRNSGLGFRLVRITSNP